MFSLNYCPLLTYLIEIQLSQRFTAISQRNIFLKNKKIIMVVRNFYKGIEIQFKRKVNMDPTKPILDLYGDSAPYENTQRAYRQPRPQPSSNSRYSRPPPQKEISYTDLKQKYQELYQAYSQKVELASSYEQQLESYRSENDRLKDQLRRVEDKNEQMNATLLNKNVELEEAYRQLQEDIRRGQKSKKNDEALDRLEEGLREAIVSNFNLLREAALSQLKQY